MALSSPLTVQPYDFIGDPTGRPLNKGRIYIGEANKDPEFYPIPVYFDQAMTREATQPIRTNNGFVDFAGSLAELYASEDIYSVKVLDEQGRKIVYKGAMMRNNLTDDALSSLNSAIVAVTQEAEASVKEAIDAVVIDGAVTDSFVSVTPQYQGSVKRTQAEKNSEVVSLLDFAAPYSTDSTTNLQSALDYLNSVGGGVLYIPYHTGTLVVSGSISLRPNVVVNCDRNLIIDCRANNANNQFQLTGSIGSEIALSANKTSGDTKISTIASHNLAVGDDFLLVSQRVTAHADAGKRWRLGETTGSGNSPYFAEPLVVKSISSSTSVFTQTPIIFPDYRTDKTLETSDQARDSSTIHKVNFSTGFKWIGGIFKKNIGGLFQLTWTKYCEIDIEVRRGNGKGVEVNNLYSLKNKIKAKVSRPIDWVLEEDHSAYNSIKDVSSWYTEVDLDEENGCQGLDQTYKLYCGIYPRYKVRHVNSREDGMTTHGNTYGAIVDICAVNCVLAAFRNRARFVTARVYSVNCGYGLRNSTYGTLDSVFQLQVLDCTINGVSFMSSGTTELTPAVKNSTISGVITMSENSTGTAILISENLIESDKYTDSRINLANLFIKSKGRAITAMDYVNAVTLNNVNIDYYGSVSPIWFRYSGGHIISNLIVDFKIGDGTIEAIYGVTFTGGTAPADAYGSPAYRIDYKTCKVFNGILLTNDDRFIATKLFIGSALGVVETVTINDKNLSSLMKLSIFRNTRLENRVVLSNKIPLGFDLELILMPNGTGKEIGFYGDDDTTTIYYTNGVNDLGSNFVSVPSLKRIKIKKIGNKEFVVS